jgi:hypothetical protein
MRLKILIANGMLAASVLYATAGSPRKEGGAVAEHNVPGNAMRLEGEKRFRANCGRCHSAPQKFPPRMMATIVRHMRVRATITDEDARLVLYYMTQ